MKNLPPRFRPEAVDRYRDTIIKIAESWPTPIIVHPSPLSKETFRSRLRDAVKAVYLHGQGEDLLPKVKTFYADYRIEEQNEEHLIIGPCDVLKHRNKLTNAVSVGSVIDGSVELDFESDEITPSGRIINALCVLLDAGFIMAATVKCSQSFVEENLPEDHHYTVLEKQGKTTFF